MPIHISKYVVNIVKSPSHFSKLNPYIEKCLKDANLYVASATSNLKIIQNSVVALVGIQRPKTFTYHFPNKEVIITLEYVALIIHIPIDNEAIIVVSTINLEYQCRRLGVVLLREKLKKDLNGCRLKFTQLETTLPPHVIMEEMDRYARSWMLWMDGGFVARQVWSQGPYHVLPLFEYFKAISRSRWGFITLTYL